MKLFPGIMAIKHNKVMVILIRHVNYASESRWVKSMVNIAINPTKSSARCMDAFLNRVEKICYYLDYLDIFLEYRFELILFMQEQALSA